MTKKFRPTPFARLVQALPKILLGLFLFVGMPYAIAQAACEPLPDQTLDKAMRNEAPAQGLAPTTPGTTPPTATPGGATAPKAESPSAPPSLSGPPAGESAPGAATAK